MIAKINARKTAHLKKPIKVERNALYEIDWSKGEMGKLLDHEEEYIYYAFIELIVNQNCLKSLCKKNYQH